MIPLLNKLPTLDKGYVALLSSTNDAQKLRDILPYISNQSLSKELDISSMTLLVKCPLFVQLHLSQHSLTILNTRLQEELEAFIPNETEIGSPDLENNRLISDDVKRTTEALLINPSAYQSDGCDRFISQVLTPISTYTTIIVHGTRRNWLSLLSQDNLPYPINCYQKTIDKIYNAEWNDGSST